VIKRDLKQTIKEINDTAMDTIAACGDVNRNVMCNPNPALSSIHGETLKVAQAISDHLTPAKDQSKIGSLHRKSASNCSSC
ncbi:hypothetical protein N8461_03205, partial [Akkermansiaceae bacterium]|nr:hypothetical protein [Akkermansiaceae bacterium]